jgi:hypothetical protein
MCLGKYLSCMVVAALLPSIGFPHGAAAAPTVVPVALPETRLPALHDHRTPILGMRAALGPRARSDREMATSAIRLAGPRTYCQP